MSFGRIFRFLFIVVACISLLANAVMIGIGVRLADAGLIGGGILRDFADIPRETRKAVFSALRDDRSELRQLAVKLREDRKAVLEIVAKEEIDPVTLNAAMAKVRASTQRLQEASHKTVIQSLTEKAAE
ncbi:MAG: periplasmic heavy metal sensor [Pseudomonadota bacterium]